MGLATTPARPSRASGRGSSGICLLAAIKSGPWPSQQVSCDRVLPDLLCHLPAAIRTCPARVLWCAIDAGQTPSLPPATSPDLAAAGHVAVACSEPGGELGEAREKR